MTTTLPNGTRVPDVASTSWAGDLEVNWQLLDAAIGAIGSNVQTNRPNTWTAEQTFSEPIVGNLTGTASRAGADEDGTSIKTGYVNVAGNQTVTGQKTWSGNQFFTSPMYPKNTSYEIGNTPASNVAIPIYFTDKNNVYTGYVRSTIYASGRTATEIRAKNAFKNGVLDPTGADISSNLNVEVQPNGAKTIYWDGLIRNDVTPFTTNNNALGSSTNQWSSVYAQTYYYNGTAWGLDKYNTWTNSQAYKLTGTEVGSTTSGYISLSFIDKNNNNLGFQRASVYSDGRTCFSWKIYNTDNNSQSISSSLEYYITKTEVKVFTPVENGEVNLGTSNNKWKTLNGINPGALSLPDYDNVITVDTTDWTVPGNNNYTPVLDGWLCVITKDSATSSIFVYASGLSSAKQYCGSVYGNGSQGSGRLSVMLPVRANVRYGVILQGDSASDIYAVRFYPCLGNV